MKTTIQRVKRIQFTEQEQEILKELNILDDKELILNDIDSQQIINILIEVNPTKLLFSITKGFLIMPRPRVLLSKAEFLFNYLKENKVVTFTRQEIVQVLLNNGFNVNVTNLTNIFNVMQCRHPVNITYDQKHLFYITKFSGKN